MADLGCLESVLVCVRCLGWAEDGGLGVDCGVVVVLLLLLVLFLLLVLGWRDLFWILLSYESGEWLSEILKLRQDLSFSSYFGETTGKLFLSFPLSLSLPLSS